MDHACTGCLFALSRLDAGKGSPDGAVRVPGLSVAESGSMFTLDVRGFHCGSEVDC